MPLSTSQSGRDFIAAFEGVVLKAYPDPGTGGAPWTIGIGHTSAAGKPVVVKGMTITRAQAFEILGRDLKTFEGWVIKLVKVKLSQPQFDALVSFCFNVGPGNFGKSSVVRHLNAGKPYDAAAAFLLWNKAAGRVLTGLVRRRKAERALFETGIHGFSDPESVGVVLRRGSDHPEAIRALQLDLITLGLLPPGEDDGDFGPITETVVSGFQETHGLTVDGRVGPATRAAMAAALAKIDRPIAVAMYPLHGQAITETLAV